MKLIPAFFFLKDAHSVSHRGLTQDIKPALHKNKRTNIQIKIGIQMKTYKYLSQIMAKKQTLRKRVKKENCDPD